MLDPANHVSQELEHGLLSLLALLSFDSDLLHQLRALLLYPLHQLIVSVLSVYRSLNDLLLDLREVDSQALLDLFYALDPGTSLLGDLTPELSRPLLNHEHHLALEVLARLSLLVKLVQHPLLKQTDLMRPLLHQLELVQLVFLDDPPNHVDLGAQLYTLPSL